jgi:xanthine dehydrogenase accessory factor
MKPEDRLVVARKGIMSVSSERSLTTAPRCVIVTENVSEILRFAADGVRGGCALVTLVGIRGGAARSIGAQMAVHADGTYCGFVSGGCTEAAVAAEAVEAIHAGADRFLTLGAGSPFIDIVLPCGGGITLAIHVLRSKRTLEAIVKNITGRRSVALVFDPALQMMTAVHDSGISGWREGRFFRVFRPRLRILLGGNGVEAETLLRLATGADVEVTRIDEANGSLRPMIDEETAVILLYHDIERERALLETALASRALYIGALGSQTTHNKRRAELMRAGYKELDVDRVKGPIGLFKTKNSCALAISILGEVVGVYEKHIEANEAKTPDDQSGQL